MSYDCSCDYDPPEFCTVTTPRARKEHRCYECGGRILKGEEYSYTAGKWDGMMSTFKVCERCWSIKQWVQNNVPCLCWAYGNMIEDCKEAVVEAQHRAKEETRGLYFGFLRLVVQRNHLNQQRNSH